MMGHLRRTRPSTNPERGIWGRLPQAPAFSKRPLGAALKLQRVQQPEVAAIPCRVAGLHVMQPSICPLPKTLQRIRPPPRHGFPHCIILTLHPSSESDVLAITYL